MEEIKESRGRLSHEEKQELIATWRSSGQSQKIFCQEHHLKYNTFVSWVSQSKERQKKKRKTRQTSGGFTELKVGLPASSFAEIKMGDGICINIYHPVSADFIRSLI